MSIAVIYKQQKGISAFRLDSSVTRSISTHSHLYLFPSLLIPTSIRFPLYSTPIQRYKKDLNDGLHSQDDGEDRLRCHDLWQRRCLPTPPSLPYLSSSSSSNTPSGAEQSRVHSLPTASAILDVFQAHGHAEIDTARAYGEGSSEEYLGALEWQKRGLVMDTKYYPTAGKSAPGTWDNALRHTPEGLRENLMKSLKALKTDKVDMWYVFPFDEAQTSNLILVRPPCPFARARSTAHKPSVRVNSTELKKRTVPGTSTDPTARPHTT